MTRSRRESSARASLRRKVEIVEEIAASGNASGSWFPTKVKELVAWSDPERKIFTWSSDTVATINGPNADLRRRFDAALARLREGSIRGRRSKLVRVERSIERTELSALREQNTLLIAKNHTLELEARRLRQQLGVIQNREADLIAKLNKLMPLDRQLRSFPGD